MKYLTIALLLTIGITAAAQDAALAWEPDMKKAAEVSLTEGKPMFLFFTGSDWCGVCMKLQREVFVQPQFTEWSKNVVLVELDFPHNKKPDPRYVDQNQTMKEMFGITGYPTIVFVKPTKYKEQYYYTKLGHIGYMAGGPDVWLNAASKFLPSAK